MDEEKLVEEPLPTVEEQWAHIHFMQQWNEIKEELLRGLRDLSDPYVAIVVPEEAKEELQALEDFPKNLRILTDPEAAKGWVLIRYSQNKENFLIAYFKGTGYLDFIKEDPVQPTIEDLSRFYIQIRMAEFMQVRSRQSQIAVPQVVPRSNIVRG